MSIIKGAQIGKHNPNLYRMRRGHTDAHGDYHESGTLYRPLRSGFDACADVAYQIVAIQGRKVCFYGGSLSDR